MLKGKKILLGITGGIAAYKTTLLVRELVKLGADVKVVMTPSAFSFVTPLTLSTLSKNTVQSQFIKNEVTGEWANHVELGKWADLFVIAPLSANSLAKMVHGIADNLLLAVYLSADCPLIVAPAMDLDMAEHWTTKENLTKLKSHGVKVLPFGEGELASGLIGKGRMAEPTAILDEIQFFFEQSQTLVGKRFIVTAGPTYESIDPVRFIGNHSSGKMGYALTEALLSRGASVCLISGPSSLTPPMGADFISIESAQQMFDQVALHFNSCDGLIMSAAVADYRPASPSDRKIKKEDGDFESIQLEPTVDILKHFGKLKKKQLVVGFALETDNEIENAKKKLNNKNLDMIVLNSLKDEGAGFATDTNKVTLITKNQVLPLALNTKKNVAIDIINEVIEFM